MFLMVQGLGPVHHEVGDLVVQAGEGLHRCKVGERREKPRRQPPVTAKAAAHRNAHLLMRWN